MARKNFREQIVAAKPIQQEFCSYCLYNTLGTTFHVDTGLKDKETGRKISVSIAKVTGGTLLQAKGGYSAKEIYESKGVLKHEKKGLLRRHEKKQQLSVSVSM